LEHAAVSALSNLNSWIRVNNYYELQKWSKYKNWITHFSTSIEKGKSEAPVTWNISRRTTDSRGTFHF
jgi:hypothetical protein